MTAMTDDLADPTPPAVNAAAMQAEAEGPAVDPTVLDLTNGHINDAQLAETEMPEGLELLDLTCNRLEKLDPRILALKGLRTVNLRQNLLTDVSAWSDAACKDVVEDIEFRDNQLKEIPSLAGMTALTRVEFSYNEIRSTSPLSSLVGADRLEELYVANNKISEIESVDHLTTLRTLELGSNRVRAIEGIASLTNLQDLWLGRNRISSLAGLSSLCRLRKISVQSNRLESMGGLEACTSLEELYLSHNGITRLEGLSTLTRLNIVDVSSNRVPRVEGLEGLTLLQDLWLNNNQIATLADVEAGLAPVASSLETIYLGENPCAKDPEYAARMRAALPKLSQLDADVLS
uniref:Protein phosphatase 1 regulatory subunit 7 n=1 Tax=Chlamydomonas euryale TaxID=1486919 RepID=A0A7R9V1C1_9CHLO|mmetsp:Transcript_14141/g.41062  ORF Transcript_14141/g.41062 Transcript_14141/m.41062 type:complete len:347 (+) Transcript_14141:147-1187(+)